MFHLHQTIQFVDCPDHACVLWKISLCVFRFSISMHGWKLCGRHVRSVFLRLLFVFFLGFPPPKPVDGVNFFLTLIWRFSRK